MQEISVSILNVNEENSLRTFYDLEVAKADYFHIDVMDGKFVKNNTVNKMLEYAGNIKKISNLPLDVHLMVEDTKKYIDEFISLEPSNITIHLEAFENLDKLKEIIEYIKSQGIKVGVAIKPTIDIKEIYPILEYIHLVLVMTVEPGEGGQKLIQNTIDKIKNLNDYRNKNNLDFYIEADGGINIENSMELKNAGVDILVVGSAIINADNYSEVIKEIKK